MGTHTHQYYYNFYQFYGTYTQRSMFKAPAYMVNMIKEM
jgi:hypothetical protein